MGTSAKRAIEMSLVAALVAISLPLVPASAAAVPGTTCSVLPADNIWNTDISTLPVHARSAAWLASTGATSGRLLHPDFGGPPYGLPFNVVSSTHATANFNFLYWRESDPAVTTQQAQGPYPYGTDLQVEAPTDSHLLTVNKDTCTLYEIGGTDYNGPRSAWAGAVFNLNSNALRPDTWTSADAAGLPIFPGLVRLDEVQSGAISHAIRFTVQQSDTSHLWPARHDAGSASNPNLPPMGARFRLKAGFDISSFNTQARVVLTGMKQYGLIVADNGSNWYFQGTMDSGWNNEPYATMVSQLKTVPASAFEAVDESSLMVNPSSGQALQPSRCTAMTAQALPVSPQLIGAQVQVTGSPGGCGTPRYEFWLRNSAGWSVVQPYGSSSSFTWNTAGQPPGTYRFSVWARDATSSGGNGTAPNTYDAFSAFDYVLTTSSCTGMSASTVPTASAGVGSPVSVTGSASGCASPRYAFYLLPPGGAWALAQPYSTNPTFNWSTAGKAAGSYRFSVWARDASSSASYDSFSAFQYTLTAAPCTAMSATTVPAGTASRGTAISVTGNAGGCPNAQYEFWLLPPGGTWTLVRGWAGNATYSWSTSPGMAAGAYRFSLWARDTSSSGTSGTAPYTYDAFSAFNYTLT